MNLHVIIENERDMLRRHPQKSHEYFMSAARIRAYEAFDKFVQTNDPQYIVALQEAVSWLRSLDPTRESKLIAALVKPET